MALLRQRSRCQSRAGRAARTGASASRVPRRKSAKSWGFARSSPLQTGNNAPRKTHSIGSKLAESLAKERVAKMPEAARMQRMRFAMRLDVRSAGRGGTVLATRAGRHAHAHAHAMRVTMLCESPLALPPPLYDIYPREYVEHFWISR